MIIEPQFREDHQVALTVEFEPELLEKARHQVARKISKIAKIPGFRPGKAPYHMIVRHVGEKIILDEAVEMLVSQNYPGIIEQAEITPYGPGTMKETLSLDPPRFVFLVPLAPRVTLGDYRSIVLPFTAPGAKEEDYQASLERLQAQQAQEVTVKRAARVGDLVYIDIRELPQEPSEGGETAPEIAVTEEDTPLVIETKEKSADDWPYPGFSRELIGLAAGDGKTVSYTYPEAYRYPEYQGRTISFKVTVDKVATRVLPVLNDAFAQSVSSFQTFEELAAEIRTQLADHAAEEYAATYEDQLISQIIAQSTIQYPPQMLEHELDLVFEQFKNRLANSGTDLPSYYKLMQKDEAGVREELAPAAEYRLRRSLMLREIANAENIQVSEEEVQAELSQTLDVAMRTLPEKEARQLLSNQESMQGLVSNIMGTTLFRHTMARLRAIASGEVEAAPNQPAEAETPEPAAPAEPQPAAELEASAAPEPQP